MAIFNKMPSEIEAAPPHKTLQTLGGPRRIFPENSAYAD